jgi:hypothetical protein
MNFTNIFRKEILKASKGALSNQAILSPSKLRGFKFKL